MTKTTLFTLTALGAGCLLAFQPSLTAEEPESFQPEMAQRIFHSEPSDVPADVGRPWEARIVEIQAAHVGENRLAFDILFDRRPDFRSGAGTFRLSLDLDNDPETGRSHRNEEQAGFEVMLHVSHNHLRTIVFDHGEFTEETIQAHGDLDGKHLRILVDAPLRIEDREARFRYQAITSTMGGDEDFTTTPTEQVALTLVEADPGALPEQSRRAFLHEDDHRLILDRGTRGVAYETLENKGIEGRMVQPEGEPFQPGRVPPPPLLLAGAALEEPATPSDEGRVEVQLLEEAGVDRNPARLRFGVPLPKGAVFDPGTVRVEDAEGQPRPAQVRGTALWPDQSLRWVVVETTTSLEAHGESTLTVEWGPELETDSPDTVISLDMQSDRIVVNTGPLEVEIDPVHFNLFQAVRMRSGDQWVERARVAAPGMVLVGEDGTRYSSANLPPDSVEVEEQGPERLTLRIEGVYADDDGNINQRYVSRLIFHAGSSQVGLWHTHVNDWLETEFADFQSLGFEVKPAGEVTAATFGLEEGDALEFPAPPVGVFQKDERRLEVVTPESDSGQTAGNGVLGVTSASGPLAVAVQDFWQRWPKGFSVDSDAVGVELLPSLPDASYGHDFPFWLQFPFVEGLYRLKWGMTFTERMVFDFAENAAEPEQLKELWAETNLPVIPVVPADWYAETGALGPIAVPGRDEGAIFEAWDEFMDQSLAAHLERQATQREFGFLNYGDWFGERGRNWGNNEYDNAHGFFMQFARTGQRDYFRAALSQARHQADVDIMHAYPDPYYVGVNHAHAIGHTGMATQLSPHGTVSYMEAHGGWNGHTWTEGMVDAWWMSADPVVMEAAILVAEHLAWAIATNEELSMSITAPRRHGWAIKALVALYRSTADPVYLQAAEDLAVASLESRHESGIWVRDRAGQLGQTCFQLGVMAAAYKDLLRETDNEEVEEAWLLLADFMKRAWPENGTGWPYIITPEAEPHPFRMRHLTAMNFLNTEGLIAAALATEDEELAEIVRHAAENLLTLHEPEARGQVLGYTIRSGNEVMGQLAEWQRRMNSLEGMDEPLPRRVANRLGAPHGEWSFRSDKGEFQLRILTGDAPGTLRLWRFADGDAAGSVARVRLEGSDDAPRTVSDGEPVQIRIDPSETGYRILIIEEDQPGIWRYQSEGLGVEFDLANGFRFLEIGIAAGALEFPGADGNGSLIATGYQSGSYGMILQPAGETKASRSLKTLQSPLMFDVFEDQLPPGSHELALADQLSEADQNLILILVGGPDLGLQSTETAWLRFDDR